ncbi:MAG: LPXTG cell wall anchor domain-containing protein [Arcobacteraceae bacterium]|jgi:LPXTG-motif cell wall-anchored protein|nr:LPXTG cell wall anchor domain-containing protein [Arcobacteraceae bacterium]
MKLLKLKSTVFAVLLFPIFLNASIWLEENKDGGESCCVGSSETKIGFKNIIVKQGVFKSSEKLNDLNNSKAWVRDFDDVVSKSKILKDTIEVATPQKGSYHIFFEKKDIENGILKVDATTTRIYNKDADIKKSIVKEIRGKTVGSHYDKPPFKELDFEIVMLQPIKKHQINCCLWSGDIAQFKIYYKGTLQKNIPLKAIMQTGWVNEVMPDKDGIVSFEIPRTNYEGIATGKKSSEKMIVEAIYDVNESGEYLETPYSKIKYSMSMPLTFSSSPLEYSSQLSGFYVVIGTTLVLSLGIYYYRRKKKKEPKEIWFDEK